jgi:hypothetical protein
VPNSKRSGKQSIDVPLPVDVDIRLDQKGRVRSVTSSQPDSEAVAEAAHFVETLEANQQLAHEPGPLSRGATHQVKTDKKGRKRLVRKRFQAI